MWVLVSPACHYVPRVALVFVYSAQCHHHQARTEEQRISTSARIQIEFIQFQKNSLSLKEVYFKSCLHCTVEKRGERSKTLECRERISSFCCICLLNTVFVLVRGMLCLAAKVELRREILKVQTLLLAVEYQPSLGLIEQSNTVQHFLSLQTL